MQQSEPDSIDWGPRLATGGRRSYLAAMLVAIVLALAGIAYLAVQGDGSGEDEMPGMEMDGGGM